MAYSLIIVRDDGVWSPQFGDRDHECVVQEREDAYLGVRGMRYEGDGKYAAKDIKIIRFPRVPTQAQITARLAEINAPPTMRVIVFDENGPHDQGDVSVEDLGEYLPK